MVKSKNYYCACKSCELSLSDQINRKSELSKQKKTKDNKLQEFENLVENKRSYNPSVFDPDKLVHLIF